MKKFSFSQLLDDLIHERIALRAATSWFNLVSVPITLGAGAYFFWLETSKPELRMDAEMLSQFYLFIVIVAGFALSLSVIGFLFVDDENEDSYVTTSLYGFYVGYFILSTFLGIFISPVFLILLFALIIHIPVFGGRRLIPALLMVIFLIVITAYAQVAGLTKPWPLVSSLSYTEANFMHITVFTYLVLMPGSVLLLIFLARAYINSFREINGRLQSISVKLSKYLSPQIIDYIFQDEFNKTEKTERKNITVFFASIENFNSRVKDKSPKEVSLILNRYLNVMTEVALEHGGTIDKFIGDEIMVFFGDPVSKGMWEDAVACVEMALAMKRRMRSLNREFAEQFSEPLSLRMGINTGYCTIGNFGSSAKMSYTAIGSHVNLASRIHDAAGGGQIFASHNTVALIGQSLVYEQKEISSLKGLKRDFQIFEILESKQEDSKGEQIHQLEKQLEGFFSEINFSGLSKEEQSFVLNQILSK